MTEARRMTTPSQVMMNINTVENQLTRTAIIAAVMTKVGRLTMKSICYATALVIDTWSSVAAYKVAFVHDSRVWPNASVWLASVSCIIRDSPVD